MIQGATTTESYNYDGVGNRLSSLGVSSYTVNSSNELTSTSTASFTYDNNGNTLTKADATGTRNYAWDFENRLSSVALPSSGGTVTFKYDPLGRRIQKSSATGTTNYLYDGVNLLEEIDNSGNAAAKYTHDDGIDEPLAMIRGGMVSFFDQDGLGSITSLTNSTGAFANTYTYDAFGNLTASTGTLMNPFQYTGRDYDPETGLRFYRARYYDPSIGRFLSEDPIQFNGGVDFYVYVGNHAPTLLDPTGTQQKTGKATPTPTPTPTPQQSAPANPAYNCMAWGLGVDWKWIQPADAVSPNKVPPHFHCTEIDCKQKIDCKLRSKVMVLEDSENPRNWHVERQSCDRGWTSKNGKNARFDSIPDPQVYYGQIYHVPTERIKAKCWSCPTMQMLLPNSPDISYGRL